MPKGNKLKGEIIMLTIWAVFCGNKDKDDAENDDFVCFYDEDKKAALRLAELIGEEVEEWTIPYRDLHELRFCDEWELILLSAS